MFLAACGAPLHILGCAGPATLPLPSRLFFSTCSSQRRLAHASLASCGAGLQAAPHSLLPPPQQHCTCPPGAPPLPLPLPLPTASAQGSSSLPIHRWLRPVPACLLSPLIAPASAPFPTRRRPALDRALYPRRRRRALQHPCQPPAAAHSSARFTMVWFHFIASCRASLALSFSCALPPGLRRTEHHTPHTLPSISVSSSLPFTRPACPFLSCLPTVPTPSRRPARPPPGGTGGGPCPGRSGPPSRHALHPRFLSLAPHLPYHSDTNFVCEQFFHRGRRTRHPPLLPT